MKGIKFQYQSIANNVDQLLLKADSAKSFIFSLKKIVTEILNVTFIMTEESADIDASVRVAFSELNAVMKKAIHRHNIGEFDDQESESDY